MVDLESQHTINNMDNKDKNEKLDSDKMDIFS